VGRSLVLHADGGSRGNPGPAGAGAVLATEDGQEVAGLSRFLGVATNNEAEYHALIMGLEEARRLGCTDLQVRLDSELIVRQLSGRYRVKSPRLKPLHERARRLLAGFERAAVGHVGRELNQRADRLANQAMDQGARQGASRPRRD
jgi:ribonuclease HI